MDVDSALMLIDRIDEAMAGKILAASVSPEVFATLDDADAGRRALKQTVRIVLNGGLGTSMGLVGPKSLLNVKGRLTFLQIILRQAELASARIALSATTVRLLSAGGESPVAGSMMWWCRRSALKLLRWSAEVASARPFRRNAVSNREGSCGSSTPTFQGSSRSLRPMAPNSPVSISACSTPWACNVARTASAA